MSTPSSPYVEALIRLIETQPSRAAPDPRLVDLAQGLPQGDARRVVESWSRQALSSLMVGALVLDDGSIDASFRLPRMIKDGRGPHADVIIADDLPRDDVVVLGAFLGSRRLLVAERARAGVMTLDLAVGTESRGGSLDSILQRENLHDPSGPLWAHLEAGVHLVTGVVSLDVGTLRPGQELSAFDRVWPDAGREWPPRWAPSLEDLERARRPGWPRGAVRRVIEGSLMGERFRAMSIFREGRLSQLRLQREVLLEREDVAIRRLGRHKMNRGWAGRQLGLPSAEGGLWAIWERDWGRVIVAGHELTLVYRLTSRRLVRWPPAAGGPPHRCLHCGATLSFEVPSGRTRVDVDDGAPPCPSCGAILWVRRGGVEEADDWSGHPSVCDAEVHEDPRARIFRMGRLPQADRAEGIVIAACPDHALAVLGPNGGEHPELESAIAAAPSPCVVALISMERLDVWRALVGEYRVMRDLMDTRERLRPLGYARDIDKGLFLLLLEEPLDRAQETLRALSWRLRIEHQGRLAFRVVFDDGRRRVVAQRELTLALSPRLGFVDRGESPVDALSRAWAECERQARVGARGLWEGFAPLPEALVVDEPNHPERCPRCGGDELSVTYERPRGGLQFLCHGCSETFDSEAVVVLDETTRELAPIKEILGGRRLRSWSPYDWTTSSP